MNFPSKPFRPIRVRSASPATVGGITRGEITIGRSHFVIASGPLAKYQASGTPSNTEIKAASTEVISETRIALIEDSELNWLARLLQGTRDSSAITGKSTTSSPAKPTAVITGLTVGFCLATCVQATKSGLSKNFSTSSRKYKIYKGLCLRFCAQRDADWIFSGCLFLI